MSSGETKYKKTRPGKSTKISFVSINTLHSRYKSYYNKVKSNVISFFKWN